MINRAELYQGDWMGHPLQSLIAILKHPPWRPQSNCMAAHILTEVQGPYAAFPMSHTVLTKELPKTE